MGPKGLTNRNEGCSPPQELKKSSKAGYFSSLDIYLKAVYAYTIKTSGSSCFALLIQNEITFILHLQNIAHEIFATFLIVADLTAPVYAGMETSCHMSRK